MSTSNQPDFLQWLLGADTTSTFWRDHWEKQLLVKHARDSFDELLTLQDLDAMLGSIQFPVGSLTMARDSTPLDDAAYCNGPNVDVQRVLAEHRRGATIILRALERWSAPLHELCRAVHDTFHVAAQTNVYLTPPESQSTPPHWDTHDLFILQTHGEKVWKIYEAPYPLPLTEDRFDEQVHTVGALTHEFTLRPGDVLYLPRGTIHEPRSTSYSVHISVGVRVTRWVDLLVDAIRLASAHDPELRKALPLATNRAGRADIGAVARGLRAQLKRLDADDMAEEAAQHHVDTFLRSLRPNVDGQLLADSTGPELSIDTPVSRRPGVGYQIDADERHAALRWGTHTLSMAAVVEPVFEFISESAVFSARDLPGTFPDTEKLALIRSLIDGGFLRRHSAGMERWR